jgi:hypothetical protein
VIAALIGTLIEVFDLYPHVEVYISATQRNEKTFQAFLDQCQANGLSVEIIQFAIPKRQDQQGPFFNDNVDIHICKVSKA